MKVCEKCGAQLEDNAQFCVSCGTKVGEAAPKQAEPAAPKASPFAAKKNDAGKGSPNKAALIGIIAAAAVVVVLLIVLIVNVAGGYKKPIKKYFAALNAAQKDAKTYVLPAEYAQEATKITYSIEDKEKISKSKLEDLADIFDDNYDKEYKFSKGYVVEVDVEYEYSKDSDKKDGKGTMYFIVVRKGMKWYVYDTTSNTSKDIDEYIKYYIESRQ